MAAIVVEKGVFFPEAKVTDISLVGPVTEDRLTLREFPGDLEDLPDLIESHYLPLRETHKPEEGLVPQARRLYWYPPLGAWWTGRGYAPYARPSFVVQTEANVPERTVALEEGASVISADGEEIGDVQRIFTDAQDNRATHLLIGEGLFLKEEKLIPTAWMDTVTATRSTSPSTRAWSNTCPNTEERDDDTRCPTAAEHGGPPAGGPRHPRPRRAADKRPGAAGGVRPSRTDAVRYLGISQNLCAELAPERLSGLCRGGHLQGLVVTDSVHQNDVFLAQPFVTVVSLAAPIARAINRIHYSRPVGEFPNFVGEWA